MEAKKEAAKKAEDYTVMDSNARSGEVRKHQIIVKTYPDDQNREPDLKTYGLNSETGTAMPQEHALKFLSDAAFKVFRPDGSLVLPPPKYDPSQPLTVKDNQTVADFDELTKASLYKRCKVLAGSEDLTMASSQGDLVDFLIAERRRQLRGNMSEAEQELAAKLESGELGGGIGDRAARQLLPDSPLVN